MDSSKVIKIALIGAGAFVLYEWLQNSGLWAQWFSAPVATVPLAQNNAPAVPITQPQGPSLPSVTAQQLQGAINMTSASSDQWCWAFQHVSGTACPSSSVIGATMTADQFLAALNQYQKTGAPQHVGLSGIVSIYSPVYSWSQN